MSLYRLDVPALLTRIEQQRMAKGLMWRELGRELNVSPSTFSRMLQGKRPDADALVTILVWLDMDTDIVYVIERQD